MATVLIADDDVDLADAWTRAFSLRGHEVVHAKTGDEAIRLLRARSFDVIITDMVMPDSGGLVVSGMARVLQKTDRIIAVSGYLHDLAGQAKKTFLQNLGVRHILHKPVEVDDLLRLISDVSEQQ